MKIKNNIIITKTFTKMKSYIGRQNKYEKIKFIELLISSMKIVHNVIPPFINRLLSRINPTTPYDSIDTGEVSEFIIN